MILLLATMRRSASAYLFRVLSLVFEALGHTTVQEVAKKHPLITSFLSTPGYGHTPGKFTIFKIVRLVGISFFEKSFPVKTHWPPNNTLRFLLRIGLIKVIHSYRDPRDVYLSTLDMGKKWAQKERFKDNVVVKFYKSDFQRQMQYLKKWVQITLTWKETKGAFLVKHEDLVANPKDTFAAIFDYCRHKVPQATLEKALAAFNSPQEKRRTHFNRGTINRYASEMSSDVLKAVNAALGKEIVELGYRL
jgi:hypothetical protein